MHPYVTVSCVAGSDPVSLSLQWFGASKYSHVDILLDDGRRLGARSDRITVKHQDGTRTTYKAGVQIRCANYEKWRRRRDFRLEVGVLAKKRMIAFLYDQIDKPYDTTAIWAFAFNRDWRKEDAWFCSELAARMFEVGQVVGRLSTGTNKVEPGGVALLCSARNAQVVVDYDRSIPLAA